jgi:hypothetical protein
MMANLEWIAWRRIGRGHRVDNGPAVSHDAGMKGPPWACARRDTEALLAGREAGW